MPDLLLELLSEEIPARMQSRASADISRLTEKALAENRLQHGDIRAYCGPRRLVLHVVDLAESSETYSEERRGPAPNAPAQAIEGFLRSTGLQQEDLEIRGSGPQARYFANIETLGRDSAKILGEIIPTVLAGFPWPKSMCWAEGNFRWVRPLRAIMCLLLREGAAPEKIDFAIEQIKSGDKSLGNYIFCPQPIVPVSFTDYQAKLEASYVYLDGAHRKSLIEQKSRLLCEEADLYLIEDTSLLEETAGLAEWPVPLLDNIEKEYLTLPHEVLRATMRGHQKFFSAANKKTDRIEAFIAIANGPLSPAREARIRKGYARVLRARLADAAFFLRTDLATPLAEMLQALSSVSFHHKLGDLAQRGHRMTELTKFLAPQIGADQALAMRAAQICKADLVSKMVHELPELQGVMGGIYAEAAGEDQQIVLAVSEHYSPLGPAEKAPHTPVSIAVALADKLDMLAQFWRINEKPTGSKDPYALRRAALGVVRIILENDLQLHLKKCLATAGADKEIDDLWDFIIGRLKVHLRDEGWRYDIIEAVTKITALDDLTSIRSRVETLAQWMHQEDSTQLLMSHRRCANILRAEKFTGNDGIIKQQLLQEGAEKELFNCLEKVKGEIKTALAQDNYADALAVLHQLNAPLNRFFDDVMVNVADKELQHNRLTLLANILDIADEVAHFAEIER